MSSMKFAVNSGVPIGAPNTGRSPFCGDLNAVREERAVCLLVLVFDEQPCLGGIHVVSILGANFRQCRPTTKKILLLLLLLVLFFFFFACLLPNISQQGIFWKKDTAEITQRKTKEPSG